MKVRDVITAIALVLLALAGATIFYMVLVMFGR